MKSKIIWTKIVVAVFALVLANWCGADEPKAGAKLPMWKVTSPTAMAYIVASVGAGSDAMYPLPKEIEEAFKNSARLYVETDDAKIDRQKMQNLMMKKAYYEKDKTLSKTIAKETKEAMVACMEEIGLELESIEVMKPALVATQIIQTAYKNVGFDFDHDVDHHFLEEARKSEKPISELETPEHQVGMIMDLPDDLQEKLLKACIQEAKNAKEELPKVWKNWKAGDAKAMEAMTLARYPDMGGLRERIVAEQNVPFAAKVEEALKGKDQVFIVIGAEQLLGEKGVLKMLEDKKYKVEQVSAAEAKK